ncbi:MAG: hypothetical protein E7625_07820 [Ruminococcaceae bacterium]|nr:hypothetical protein [Oscillospiraceae bacterium]
MKKILSCVLLLTVLLLPLAGCAKDDARISGAWIMASYVTEDGVDAEIENALYMLFYSSGYGETKSESETYQSFTYTAKRGKMTRELDLGNGQIEVLEETYEISEDGLTLTIRTPKTRSSPGATITLKKYEH